MTETNALKAKDQRDTSVDQNSLLLRLDEVRPDRRVVKAKANPQPASLPQRSVRETVEHTAGWRAKFKIGGLSGSQLSFLILVALPTILGALYFAFIASPQYMSEFRFSVRAADGASATMPLAAEAAVAMSNSYIVSDYALSRDAITEVDKAVDLRKLYRRDGIDFLSRLSEDPSVEQLTKYWARRASTNYDLATGINTVQVTAFTPKDAYDIATALESLSEKLVNDISEKARQSQMAFSKTELDRAEMRLRDVRAQQTELRAGQKTLDARREADEKIQLTAKMRGNLAELKAEYASLSSYMSPSSPKLSLLKTQIAAAQQQIDQLQAQIGSAEEPENGGTLDDAQLVAKYDQLQADTDIAMKLYQSTLTAYEAARMQASNNQIYLATYVHPGMPETAAYPHGAIDTILVFVAAVAMWIVSTLVYFSIRDHA
ncbi:hypothetical protein [Rhizobium sp. RAF56]|uniref:hypothetical protein n=1 Tax=Rhizobium sp. RAF56 TaxID=3233062 RepID=UPI003F98F772